MSTLLQWLITTLVYTRVRCYTHYTHNGVSACIAVCRNVYNSTQKLSKSVLCKTGIVKEIYDKNKISSFLLSLNSTGRVVVCTVYIYI